MTSVQRLRMVDGREYQVPRHIVRIQAGWQVRYGTWTSFADGKCGGTGVAFEIAKAYLRAEYKHSPPPAVPNRLLKREVKSRKTIKCFVGCNFTWKRERPTSKHKTLYVDIWVPQTNTRSTRAVRLYIGSAMRVDRDRVISARRQLRWVDGVMEDVRRELGC